MAYETGYRSTAAERRAKAAEAASERVAEDARQAALTLDEYLAEVAAQYGVTHTSNVAAGEDREWYVERHATLVALYAS